MKPETYKILGLTRIWIIDETRRLSSGLNLMEAEPTYSPENTIFSFSAGQRNNIPRKPVPVSTSLVQSQWYRLCYNRPTGMKYNPSCHVPNPETKTVIRCPRSALQAGVTFSHPSPALQAGGYLCLSGLQFQSEPHFGSQRQSVAFKTGISNSIIETFQINP